MEKIQEHRSPALQAHSLFNKSLCLRKSGRRPEADLALQSALTYLPGLSARKEMFGVPGEPIKLATIAGTMIINENDER